MILPSGAGGASQATATKIKNVLAKLRGHNGTRSTRFYYEVRDSRAIQTAKTLKLHPVKSEAG